MRAKDLFWLLGFPVYYLINAMRHEMAHALAAELEGAQLTSVAFWPVLNGSGQIVSQSTQWQGQVNWMVAAMPFLIDLLTFVAFFYVCMAVPFQRRWIWLNLVIIGLISPFLNSLYNYFIQDYDLRVVLQAFSSTAVNIYFVFVLFYYLLGLILVFGFSRTALPSPINS